jgi:hypothetical protein
VLTNLGFFSISCLLLLSILPLKTFLVENEKIKAGVVEACYRWAQTFKHPKLQIFGFLIQT